MSISVIIPAYNAALTLPRCLDSVLAQQTDGLEIVVVDDGSTDETPQILDAYARAHDNIKVCSQPNRGQAAARNEALRHATGEWILFLDADDYWGPDYLRPVLSQLTDGIDVLQTGFTRQPLTGKPTVYPCRRPYRYLSAWSKIIRRSFLLDHQIRFPEGLYYDDPVWAATLWSAKPRIALSRNTDYHYTIHNQSVTANPKPSAPVRRELRRMGLRLWSFGWLRLRLTAHFIKQLL